MGFDRSFAIIIDVPIIIITEIIRYLIARKRNIKFFPHNELVLLMLFFYLIALVSITLLPFYTDMKVEASANLVPVVNTVKDINYIVANGESYMIKFWLINIIGNLLLLSPLAILIPILSNKFRSIKASLILCFSVSLAIELLQYLSMYFGNIRSVDIDDVILNTLGAFIGFALFKIVNKYFIKYFRACQIFCVF